MFAITVHEAAHGYVAWKFGDNTAKKLGRISINPLKHIDIVGTVILPILMVVTTGLAFGWAKPVPVNPNYFKNPKRDMAYVAIAGPLSNLLMAIFWIIVLKLGFYCLKNDVSGGFAMFYMGQAGILINLILMILNLIPIPPLDGSKVLLAILPKPWDLWLNKATPFGLILVVILMVSGYLSKIILPILTFVQSGLFAAFGLG